MYRLFNIRKKVISYNKSLIIATYRKSGERLYTSYIRASCLIIQSIVLSFYGIQNTMVIWLISLWSFFDLKVTYDLDTYAYIDILNILTRGSLLHLWKQRWKSLINFFYSETFFIIVVLFFCFVLFTKSTRSWYLQK